MDPDLTPATDPDAGLDDATRRQIAAAHPGRSTWLAANAGSGKTRVLTDRVARLLLGGTPPQNILCLTFTKAAAGEMQNRLFARLGDWAMKEDAELAKELRAIGVREEIGPKALSQARTLFAKAIETPGGLKIQTIHSFCASVLRHFPLEAGVSPGFREIDDRASKLLRAEIFDLMAEGPDSAALAEFARYCSADKLDDLLAEIVSYAEAFAAAPPEDEILSWFGLSPADTQASLLDQALDPGARAAMREISDALSGGTVPNKRDSGILARLAEAKGEAAFDELCRLIITAEGTPKQVLLKATAKQSEAAAQTFLELADHLAMARNRLVSLEEAQKTLALHRFARLYVAAHAARKEQAGVLDFDDLIRATLRLLSQSAMAEWVLFRLDGGIDHILVDEAQDTSPQQWAIIERLAQEFASGAGARSTTMRTIFAVGDRKQSIYSFQGADPAEFDRMRDHFRDQLALSDRELSELSLLHSFRSSPVLLGLVDKIFDGSLPQGTGEATEHIAFKTDLPGRADLWPLIQPAEAENPPEWHDASDRTVPQGPALQLAERLADEIARMVGRELIPDGKGGARVVTAGDILVLVRRRSLVSEPLILALKRRGVDVAGADQIVLASELAVMDVLALLKVLVTPADDLSLASVLRSPIFGLSEADLYHLAQPRAEGETLWQALEAAADRHPGAVALLDDMRRQADYLRPFDLIERLLVRHRARQLLSARLGAEVEEALDVFLHQALAYESGDVPSLTGFLAWHEADGVKIKRQSEGAGQKLRVMTVHGSKGLESQIVILPDTADYSPPVRERLIELGDGQAVFRSSKDRRPAPLVPLYEAEAQRNAEESNRLLYVALTRPRQWLITCGAGKDAAKDEAQPCWHRLIGSAMQAMGAAPAELAGSTGLRLQSGDWPAAIDAAPGAEPAEMTPDLPVWADLPAEPGPQLLRLISPSRLGSGAHAVVGEDGGERDEAMRRGTWLHLLLEHLPLHPQSAWPDLSAALLRQGEVPALDAEIAQLLDEAAGVLASPDLGWLFQAEALTEVDLTAALPQAGARLYGRIDRLVRREDGSLLAVDFKSNALVPERPEAVPEGILAQLGAYAHALAQIFRGTPTGVAVLWTRNRTLMEVPTDLVLAALSRARI